MKLLYQGRMEPRGRVVSCAAVRGAAGAQTVTTGRHRGNRHRCAGRRAARRDGDGDPHTDTGTSYEAVTGGDGRYNVLNVRVGTYTIAVDDERLQGSEAGEVPVQLGGQQTVDFKLQLASVTRDGRRRRRHAAHRQVARRHGRQHLERGSIESAADDLAQHRRHRAHVAVFQRRRASTRIRWHSVASRAATTATTTCRSTARSTTTCSASRPSGTPGGQTETQPISLDAIQEIQLVVSPYDVRQGGFSGGGINAITKSGTNALHGTAYYFGRNQDWVGQRASEPARRSDVQGQAVRRQPRRADRAATAFFFGNVRLRPQGHAVRLLGRFDAASSSARSAEIERFVDIAEEPLRLQTRRRHRASSPARSTTTSSSSAATSTSRTRHQLTVRHNYHRRARRHRHADDRALPHAGQLLPVSRTRRTRPSGS